MENLNSARRARFPRPLWERVDRAKREPGEGADSRERQNPLTRLAHFRSLGTLSQPKSDISDFGQSNNCRTRVNPSSAGRGERTNTLLHLHHFFRLGADAGNAFDRQRRAAGFVGDLAVLLHDEAERGLVLVQAAEQFGRHAPVRALRAVLIDDVEEHEFAFGVGSRFLGHGGHPMQSMIPKIRSCCILIRLAHDPIRKPVASFRDPALEKKTPALARRRYRRSLTLDGLQIGGSGLAAARIGLHVERELLALVEVAHASALDCRDVNEHIGAAAVLHDEAEALLGVEELNGTCGHSGLL